nr:HTH domain-containing protein [Agathobacter rectalis]
MHRQCTAIPSETRYDIFFSYFKKENKEMSEKRCYTVQELQEILGVSRSTIYNRC